jgi:hypothetical protein
MYSLRGPSWRPPRFVAAVAAGVAAAVVLVLLAGAFAGGRATDPDDPRSGARLEAARLEADRIVVLARTCPTAPWRPGCRPG